MVRTKNSFVSHRLNGKQDVDQLSERNGVTEQPEIKRPKASLNDYLAEERTFLAWIRTGLALMGFGFVVAKFGIFLSELQITRDGHAHVPHWVSPWFGMVIIATGVVVNGAATLSYVRMVHRLNRGEAVEYGVSHTAVGLALFLALLGVGLGISLTLRF